ncbi:MAG: lactate racemase domain-containing protein [Actinomycetota bacterium]
MSVERTIPYGDGFVGVRLPERTRVISPGTALDLGPAGDLAALVRRALDDPIDRPPLREQVRSGDRVTVAFDDPTVPCYAPLWPVALSMIVEDLERGGVATSDISLICANALHRQFTHDELSKLIGPELVAAHSDRLHCHDAEDERMIVHLGTTGSGHSVDVSRRVVDSDLTVYLNCSTMRGFSGGWKSVCVGLSSYSSIHHHHTPDTMSMSLDRNKMHEILDEMGAVVDRELGDERIFKLETVLADPLTVHDICSGSVRETRRAVVDKLRRKQPARRALTDERFDIVVYGVPDWSPYAAFSHGNPILDLVSTGLGYLGGMIQAVGSPGCTVVIANPCPKRFNETHHPSYVEVWEEVLPGTTDPDEARRRYEPDLAARADYIDAYRHANAFHPTHAIMALYPLKRLRHAGRVVVAGAQDASVPERCSFEPAASVEDAVADAEDIHGKDAGVALIDYPMAFNRQ